MEKTLIEIQNIAKELYPIKGAPSMKSVTEANIKRNAFVDGVKWHQMQMAAKGGKNDNRGKK